MSVCFFYLCGEFALIHFLSHNSSDEKIKTRSHHCFLCGPNEKIRVNSQENSRARLGLGTQSFPQMKLRSIHACGATTLRGACVIIIFFPKLLHFLIVFLFSSLSSGMHPVRGDIN